jgi:hypothetical protein
MAGAGDALNQFFRDEVSHRIGERTGQAIYLVKDDDLNFALLAIGEQPLERRALPRPPERPPSYRGRRSGRS